LDPNGHTIPGKPGPAPITFPSAKSLKYPTE
jgi:hypothetical protein